MAIVKMKGLRLIAMQQDREQLLEQLQRLGCVEVEEPTAQEPGPEWEALSRPDDSGLSQARECRAAAERALAALRTYAPGKSSFLKVRPELSQREFFDDAGYTAALRAAEEINEAERHIKASSVQKSKLQSQKAALAPGSTWTCP